MIEVLFEEKFEALKIKLSEQFDEGKQLENLISSTLSLMVEE